MLCGDLIKMIIIKEDEIGKLKKEITDLEIGEWEPFGDEFTVCLGENDYYSSKNQDAIIQISLLVQTLEKIKKLPQDNGGNYNE